MMRVGFRNRVGFDGLYYICWLRCACLLGCRSTIRYDMIQYDWAQNLSIHRLSFARRRRFDCDYISIRKDFQELKHQAFIPSQFRIRIKLSRQLADRQL